MKSTQNDSLWLNSKTEELKKISTILNSLGFSLDESQPHISGERYLMTKDKLVLAGHRVEGGEKVIIKASRHPDGQKEIQVEKKSRDILKLLAFAKKTITFPDELYFGQHGEFLIWITLFIPQDKVFVAHGIEEQFFLALRAFEAQETFHATTFEHLRNIKDTFPIFKSPEYLREFENFKRSVADNYPDEKLNAVLEIASVFLETHKETIDRYANHLTHTDFVPHNFRIKGHDIYMLDCSSVYFGNKYEAWARFLNYMLIHNPTLEQLLSEYLRKNRGEEESLSLRLMRVFKLGKLLEYYTRSLAKTTGDLHALTLVRIKFWQEALVALLADTPLSEKVRNEYITSRDQLRSPEEKERQREFSIA